MFYSCPFNIYCLNFLGFLNIFDQSVFHQSYKKARTTLQRKKQKRKKGEEKREQKVIFTIWPAASV